MGRIAVTSIDERLPRLWVVLRPVPVAIRANMPFPQAGMLRVGAGEVRQVLMLVEGSASRRSRRLLRRVGVGGGRVGVGAGRVVGSDPDSHDRNLYLRPSMRVRKFWFVDL